jgi:TRAP-type mannitol/chloroaromatic compound transport system permease small subunit
MRFWLLFSSAIDAVNRRIGLGVSWLILLMTLVSAFNAISRKLFNVSSNAFLEIQWVLFAAVFLLAAGYTLLSNEHVRVDILNARLRVRWRLWLELFCTLFFLGPFALLVLWYGWPYFALSFAGGEVSLQAGGLILWPAKLLIPVGFLLLLLQGVSQAIKVGAALGGHYPAEILLDRRSVGDGDEPVRLREQQARENQGDRSAG